MAGRDEASILLIEGLGTTALEQANERIWSFGRTERLR